MNHSKAQSYLFIHVAVILWGFTAILGELITLRAIHLVWWRVAIISLCFVAWPGMVHKVRSLSPKVIYRISFIGVIVGLHWLCFYGSIKLANASIALISFSTTAFFTSFIEPIYTKSKISRVDVLFGLLVIPAMILVTKDFSWIYLLGFGVGILSALLAAYFSVLNKVSINFAGPDVMTFIEMLAAFCLVTLIIPFVSLDQFWVVSPKDVAYLLFLSIFCTILPFILHLKALKELSAFVTNLIVNLEPVYGILLAVVILNNHDELNWSFYAGGSILVVLVFLYPYVKKRYA